MSPVAAGQGATQPVPSPGTSCCLVGGDGWETGATGSRSHTYRELVPVVRPRHHRPATHPVSGTPVLEPRPPTSAMVTPVPPSTPSPHSPTVARGSPTGDGNRAANPGSVAMVSPGADPRPARPTSSRAARRFRDLGEARPALDGGRLRIGVVMLRGKPSWTRGRGGHRSRSPSAAVIPLSHPAPANGAGQGLAGARIPGRYLLSAGP